jgi:hypothetical protein
MFVYLNSSPHRLLSWPLKALLDDGIVTEDEFLNKKRELLARL